MVTTVRSLGLQGISGYEVTVECFLSGGLPAFDVVGLGDTAVKDVFISSSCVPMPTAASRSTSRPRT